MDGAQEVRSHATENSYVIRKSPKMPRLGFAPQTSQCVPPNFYIALRAPCPSSTITCHSPGQKSVFPSTYLPSCSEAFDSGSSSTCSVNLRCVNGGLREKSTADKAPRMEDKSECPMACYSVYKGLAIPRALVQTHIPIHSLY